MIKSKKVFKLLKRISRINTHILFLQHCWYDETTDDDILANNVLKNMYKEDLKKHGYNS